MALKRILKTIFEVDFLGVSFGFRPKHSCHDALDVVDSVTEELYEGKLQVRFCEGCRIVTFLTSKREETKNIKL